MKIRSLLIVFLLTFFSGFSHAKKLLDDREYIRNNFPNLEEVISYLNDNFAHECESCEFDIAKKIDGYYVKVYDHETKKTSEVFTWSRFSGSYLEVNAGKLAGPEERLETFKGDFSALYDFREKYDFMLFFGYDNWANDVIKLLSDYSSSLSPQDHEILGRAYGDLALKAISEKGHTRDYARLSKDKLNEVIKFADLSLENWSKIKSIDPNYIPLIIKNLDLKVGNEHMHFYNLFVSIKEEKIAAKYLKNAWYTPSQVQCAKNLLYGCSENGFLFSQGDSDTFPLWYVQKKLDYKNDVIVLNTSLMYTPWYLQMNKEKYKYKSALNQSNYTKLLEKGQYVDHRLQVEPFKNWLENKLTFSDSSELQYDIVPKTYILAYDGSNLELSLNGGAFPHNQIAILDLISSNPDRSYSFVSPYQLYSLGLIEHYLERGKSFLLSGEKRKTKSDAETVKQLDNLVYYMDASYLKGMTHNGSSELNFICYGISTLSNEFMLDKVRLTDQLIKQLPYTEVIKFDDYNLLEIMNSFYDENRPNLSIALKKDAKPLILDRIQEISSVNKNLDNDIRDIEEIFSIYAGNRAQWMEYETPVPEEADKEVLLALQKKVNELYASKVVAYRKWTLMKLQTLNKAFDLLGL